MIDLKLREVGDSDSGFLYKLLKKRDLKANLSHKKMPSYKQHIKFMKSKPYQKWYIIEKNRKKLGTIYFSKQNEKAFGVAYRSRSKKNLEIARIGIHFLPEIQSELISQASIQELIRKNPKKKYFTNVSPKNQRLIKFFEKNGFFLFQYTFEYNLVKIATNFIDSRKCEFQDPDLAFEIIDDKHTNHIIKWRNDPSNFSIFAVQEKLTKTKQRKFLKNYTSLNRIDFILVDKQTRKPHGTFSLKNIFSDRPEIGKLLGTKELRGKGIAYKATKALLSFAFRELNLKKVYAIIKPDNISNISLNQKLGFKIIGNEKINSRKFIIMTLKNNLV